MSVTLPSVDPAAPERPQPRPSTSSVRLILTLAVAGAVAGPPEFDLVKHLSYAGGELYAIRCGATSRS